MSDSLCWHSCKNLLPAVGLPIIVKIPDGNHRVCVHHGDGLFWDLFDGRYLEGVHECPTGYKCHICRNKKKGVKLEVHHIIFRSNGGSDEVDNLITLCHDCHKKLHDGKVKLNLKGKPKGQLNHTTQMNSIRLQLLKHYPEAIETFGYVTKANRQTLNIEKDHHIDACIIASCGNEFNIKSCLLLKRDIPEGDKQQTKGIRGEQRLNTEKIQGFRKFDKVKYFGKEYFIKGRMSSGYAVLMDIEGNKVDFSNLPKGHKTPKLSLCKRISARRSQLLCVTKN